MIKEIILTIVMVVTIFLCFMGYQLWTEYRVKQALQPLMNVAESISQDSKRRAAEQQLREDQRKQKEIERQAAEIIENSACGINESTGECRCLDIRTGQRVEFPEQACVWRARSKPKPLEPKTPKG